MRRLVLVLLGLVFIISGCSSTSNKSSSGGGRYALKDDRYPAAPVDVSKVPDAVPRPEPLSRGGNKSPYKVLGRNYYVMESALGYRQKGTASWYGEKFHGHQTSNGEVYDMYTMTAAHKTLPIPTYVRVTNLGNGRQVIVRVNDRGPFHDDRLIDLSYAAAARLDMLGRGTARVEVEAIDPRTWSTSRILASSRAVPAAAAPTPVAVGVQPTPTAVVSERFLQVGAYASASAAEQVRGQLAAVAGAEQVNIRSVLRQGKPLYRVLIGPLDAQARTEELIAGVQAAGHPAPMLVHYP